MADNVQKYAAVGTPSCVLIRLTFMTKRQAWSSRNLKWGILRSECDGTRWRTGGEVKGKLANGVGSQYSHTPSQRGLSTITNADAHTSAASSRLNWLPRRFKWTRPFKRKTKTGFCACAIRFRTSSTDLRCAASQKRADLIGTAAETWYHT